MNPFLFLFTIVYLTPSISGRSIIPPNSNPKSALQSHQSPPAEGHSRSKRSLTAFLAAEVLFLEGLLAAQNSRKPRKISRPLLVNTIDTNRVKKQVKKPQLAAPAPSAPPPQLFQFRAPPRPTVSSTVSSLDPFIMLTAPDLSKNNYGEFELYQTRHSSSPPRAQSESVTHSSHSSQTFHLPADSFSARKPRKRTLHYGAFELYHL